VISWVGFCFFWLVVVWVAMMIGKEMWKAAYNSSETLKPEPRSVSEFKIIAVPVMTERTYEKPA
jgi:uncharacterized membrane protein